MSSLVFINTPQSPHYLTEIQAKHNGVISMWQNTRTILDCQMQNVVIETESEIYLRCYIILGLKETLSIQNL